MKFSCEKYLLQGACMVASRAAASKSPIPALEGLQISCEDKLYIKGYDLKKGIVTGVEADISQRGTVVVGARLFGEMIRRLPDGIVTVSSDEKDNISVKCGKSQFNILGISADDYPELPRFDAVNSVTLPQKLLKDMINKTIFAVSTDEVRPIYTGTLFEVESERLTLVSVDGYRLARRTEQLESVPRAFAPVGRGNLNWAGILAAARSAGIERFVVEQDCCDGDEFDAVRVSLENLNRLGVE